MASAAPDWACLHLHALAPANLPRVLAGFGFDRIHGPMPRGGVPVLARPPFAVLVEPWPGYHAELAGWPCRLLVRDSAPRLAVYVCEVDGAWSDARGGARDESLIGLGAYAWNCRWGSAGARIARLCGLAGVPPLRPPPPGAGAPFRPVAA